LQKYAPADFTVDRFSDQDLRRLGWERLAGYDLIFALDYSLAAHYSLQAEAVRFRGPLVFSFNKDHRSREREWCVTLWVADWTVVNNRDRYEYGGVKPKTCCISNGLDTEHWRSTTPFNDRPQKAVWCGRSGAKKGKNYDSVIAPLRALLESAGVQCDFRAITGMTDRQVLTPDEQLAWYNSARYVVCASETEGTPGYLFEAMACGCVPVTTQVGNVPEVGILSDVCVVSEPSAERFRDRIVEIRDSQHGVAAEVMSSEVKSEMWTRWGYGPPARRADYFFQLFRRLIDGQPIKPFCHWDIKPEEI
jgi:glycosyltransferase involved in cell wall biosynthesis